MLVDPGDEPAGRLWTELDCVVRATGKPLTWILITHSHPDHVANLPFLAERVPGIQVLAHSRSPVPGHRRVTAPCSLPVGPGIRALPTPGHSAAGDDLAFWVSALRVLFSGDLVQPKGETWDQAFYPSPYPYFTDGDTYLRSLEALWALPVEILVTGHREVREHAEARRWIELTIRAIRRVEEAVRSWDGPEDLTVAAPEIFRRLCDERGIPPEVVRGRMARSGGQPSPFERYDLPGIAWYWNKHRSAGRPFDPGGCGTVS